MSEAGGQLAGERIDDLFELGQVRSSRVHQVDILQQRLAKGLGDGLPAAIGNQATPDLITDLLTQLFDSLFEFFTNETLLEIRSVSTLFRVEETFEKPVDAQLPKGPVQVVGASNRTARLDAGIIVHRLPHQSSHCSQIIREQRLEERLEQLIEISLATGSWTEGLFDNPSVPFFVPIYGVSSANDATSK